MDNRSDVPVHSHPQLSEAFRDSVLSLNASQSCGCRTNLWEIFRFVQNSRGLVKCVLIVVTVKCVRFSSSLRETQSAARHVELFKASAA